MPEEAIEAPLGVLMLSPYLPPNVGGQETHLTSLCDALDGEGVAVWLLGYRPLTTQVGGYRRWQRQGTVRTIRLPWPHGSWVYWVMHRTVWRYFLYLAPGLFFGAVVALIALRGQVTVIHAHGLVAALVARVLGPVFGVRVVMSTHAVYHLDENPGLAAKVSWIAQGAHRIVALSEPMAKDLLATGVPEERVVTVTQWIDTDAFSPDGEAAQEPADLAPKGSLRVLCVGRLYDGKGFHVLAEAVAQTEGVHLFIVGEGPERERLATFGPRVHLLGSRPPEELPALYRAVEAAAVPSLVAEGFSRVTVEAFACGRPVLVANRGNLPLLVDEATGFVAEPAVEGFREALSLLREANLAEMGALCRLRAVERYGPANVKAVLEAYRYGA